MLGHWAIAQSGGVPAARSSQNGDGRQASKNEECVGSVGDDGEQNGPLRAQSMSGGPSANTHDNGCPILSPPRVGRNAEQLDVPTDTLISRTCKCLLRETGLAERRRGYARRAAMDKRRRSEAVTRER
eukprot:7857611-Pyramimonas_sp.AAC.1